MSKHYVVMVNDYEGPVECNGSSYPIGVYDTFEEALERAKTFDNVPSKERTGIIVTADKTRPEEEIRLRESLVGNCYPLVATSVRMIRYESDSDYYVDYIWIVEV